MDYDGLLSEIMTYVNTQLTKNNCNTRVVLIPSTNEISHIYPLPQPPLSQDLFKQTKMAPVLVSNPSMFSVNDVSIGIVNSDVLKDMCINMCVKNPPATDKPNKSKIDLVLESILQQRNFYPLYPSS